MFAARLGVMPGDVWDTPWIELGMMVDGLVGGKGQRPMYAHEVEKKREYVDELTRIGVRKPGNG